MNLKSLRNPDLYHGRLSKNYFEGWYFKVKVTLTENPASRVIFEDRGLCAGVEYGGDQMMVLDNPSPLR